MAIILFIPLLWFISSEVTCQVSSGDGSNYHINIKAGDEFHPETKADPNASPETLRIEADYDEDPVLHTRSSKRMVDIGTWTAPDRKYNITWEGGFQYNICYQIHQEGYNADPEFRFELEAGGLHAGVNYDAEDTGDEYIIRMSFDYMERNEIFIIEPEDPFSLNIQYSGYEDCTIYFDNATWDSGMLLEANILSINNTIWKKNYIEFDIVDSFGTNWGNVIQYFDISQGNDSIPFSNFEVTRGESVTINGTIVETQRIRLILDGSISKEEPIRFSAKYTQRSFEENEATIVTLYYQSKDNDDDEFISGFDWFVLTISVCITANSMRGKD